MRSQALCSRHGHGRLCQNAQLNATSCGAASARYVAVVITRATATTAVAIERGLLQGFAETSQYSFDPVYLTLLGRTLHRSSRVSVATSVRALKVRVGIRTRRIEWRGWAFWRLTTAAGFFVQLEPTQ